MPPAALRRLKEPAIVLLILAAAIAVVYAVVLGAPVVYDDDVLVRGNPAFLLPPAEFWSRLWSLDYFAFTQERSYQPLVTLLHYPLFRLPWAYRSLGLALHAANGLLVYAIGRRLAFGSGQALAAALLFALFPASTEALNISSFKGHPLALAFSLSTLLAWMRTGERPSAPAPLAPARGAQKLKASAPLLLAHLSLVFALLSKETGLIAPALVVVHALCYLRGRPRAALWRASGLLALSALYLWFRFGLLPPPPSLAPGERAVATLWLPWESFGWYLKTLIAPLPLCLEHSLDHGPSATARAGAAFRMLLPALYALLLWRWRRRSDRLFLLLWILAATLPFLHLIPFSNYSPVADRYLYAASAGLSLLAVRGLWDTRMRAALLAVALAWGALSIARNALYRDTRALYEQTAACAPGNPRAHALLAGWHYSAGRDYPAALEGFRRAFALAPELLSHFRDPGLVHAQRPSYILGLIHHRMGDEDRAAELLERALGAESRPLARAALHEKLGDVHGARGDLSRALAEYRAARAILPHWGLPYLKEGLALQTSQPARALALMERSRALTPDHDEPHRRLQARIDRLLGDAYLAQGMPERAVRAWESAEAKVPGRLDLLLHLADTYRSIGDRSASASAYRRALAAADRTLARLRRLPEAGAGTAESERLISSVRRQARKAEAALRELESAP
ncbi:MAG: hypothetical protein ABII00_06040 [Elusimicrobiota bacterium]